MHRHFNWDAPPWEGRTPRRLYALLDHSEPTTVTEGEPALFSFDAVEADGFDALGEFGSQSAQVAATVWRNYWTSLLPGQPPRNDPFRGMDLYRLDVVLEPADPNRTRLAQTQRPEDKGKSNELIPSWLEIHIVPFGQGTPAEIYPQMFGAPIQVGVQIKLPSPQRAASLAASFSLRSLPHVSWSDVQNALSSAEAAALNVYDVGQGSASALTDDRFVPTVYFDLGCGVYRNQKTSPPDLAFCYTRTPPILLSHWDADHWAGAYAPSRGSRSALQMTWIMPHQQVSPIHLCFANDILIRGGTVWIFDPPAGSVHSMTLADGCSLELTRCSGTTRNDSGFAMCISESAESDLHWLLTGDAAYDYILHHLGNSSTLKFQAVVVPHHGAELSHQSMVPLPLSADPAYQRLLFSFGPNNAHGRRSTSHPKSATVDLHAAAGWNVDRWKGVAAPGHRVAQGEVRATGKNGPGCERLHSVVINWKGDLVTSQATACQGKFCSHRLGQW